MRLWHQDLISKLDNKRLLDQHRTCCCLRGKGWGMKNSLVGYIFEYDPSLLVTYHKVVMYEMRKRGLSPDIIWENPNWRGSNVGIDEVFVNPGQVENQYHFVLQTHTNIFPEHNEEYYKRDVELLKQKEPMYEKIFS